MEEVQVQLKILYKLLRMIKKIFWMILNKSKGI